MKNKHVTFFGETRRLLRPQIPPTHTKGISAQSCGHCAVGWRNGQEWRQTAAAALKRAILEEEGHTLRFSVRASFLYQEALV